MILPEKPVNVPGSCASRVRIDWSNRSNTPVKELSETIAACGSRLFHPGGAGYDGAVIWSRPKFE
jgi:hypothetical protein